jgi:hypothetical protein
MIIIWNLSCVCTFSLHFRMCNNTSNLSQRYFEQMSTRPFEIMIIYTDELV